MSNGAIDGVRVKELEAKVKQLESENQKLLNKVFMPTPLCFHQCKAGFVVH